MARASTAAVRLLTGEREPVRLATTANITTVEVDGLDVIQGLKTVDGVLTEVGDRVLVKNQTDQTLNGIYTASEGTWYRAADARTSRTMQKGTTVHVQLGSANAGNVYSFQTDRPNIGADNIVLALYMTGSVTYTKDNDATLAADSDDRVASQKATKAYMDNKGPPVVILSTGQSLATYHPALAWSPEPNLFLWNWDGMIHTEAHVGTAFAPMDDASMGYAYAYANMVAKTRPSSKVYLINIGRGGRAIAEWMVGASSPSMYDAVKANVEAALDVLGVDQVDEFLWRQGESDVGSITYVADFNEVIDRFRDETWFPTATPATILGMSPINGSSAAYNFVLAACAAEDYETRRFVSMETLPTSFWDPDTVHMTAEGYQASGILAFMAGWSTGDSFYVNPETKEWVHRYDQDASTKLTVKNGYAGTNAWASMIIESAQGALYLQALGSAGTAAMTWYGNGPLYFQANHANGSMIFQTGGTNTRMTIAADGTITTTGKIVSTSPTGGVGYGTGSGGTVTQATSKTTAVTLNKVSGTITTHNASLAANTTASFVFTNSAIAAGDVLVLNHVSGGTAGSYTLNARCVGGGAAIDVRNITSGALGEAIVIAFALVKGATS